MIYNQPVILFETLNWKATFAFNSELVLEVCGGGAAATLDFPEIVGVGGAADSGIAEVVGGC